MSYRGACRASLLFIEPPAPYAANWLPSTPDQVRELCDIPRGGGRDGAVLSARGSRRSSEAVLLVVLRRDLLLALDVQGVAFLLRFCERDQGVLGVTDLSSSAGAQAVKHTEVKRANEPKV
jgi:hypothetical protein